MLRIGTGAVQLDTAVLLQREFGRTDAHLLLVFIAFKATRSPKNAGHKNSQNDTDYEKWIAHGISSGTCIYQLVQKSHLLNAGSPSIAFLSCLQ
ncbi:MAG: hypothetical protein ACYC46_09805 [Acidobacteriaceae bacterium]